jgi:hypothetical protein
MRSSNNNPGSERRKFLRSLAGLIAGSAIGAAALPLGGDDDDDFPNGAPGAREPAGAAVSAYLGPVRPGQVFAGATVERIYDVHLGAVAIVAVSASGARFQIDMLAAGEGDGAVGRTRSVSLFVRGRPCAPTPEDQGLAAMAIADALRAREAAGAVAPPGLLALGERLRLYPGGHFDALA